MAIIRAVNNSTGRPQRTPDAQITNWIPLNSDGKTGLKMRVAAISPYQSAGVADSRDSGGIVFDPYGAVVASNGFNPQATGRVFAVQLGFGPDVDQYKSCVVVRTLLGAFKEEKGGKCPNL